MKKRTHTVSRFVLAWLAVFVLASPAGALDAADRQRADEAISRGVVYLQSTQAPDGSWTPQVGPAVTGLALRALIDAPGVTANDPAVANARQYLLDHAQPDGSIRNGPDGILANYNTAICVSALAKFSDPESQQAVQKGVAFLKGLQWQDGMADENGQAITQEHPFYGGAGYGRHGRPDLSNTQMMVQALHDAGVSSEDPAYQRAVVFITRLQGTEANDYYPEGTFANDGGAVYATSINKELVGVPQSMANPEMIDEGRAGRPVSGLRGYGTMTYAAFKSYLYADLTPADQRVHDALNWIGANYTLDRNPGLPEGQSQQGLFYYYLVHARALAAFGRDTIETSDGQVDWAVNLIDALAQRQQADGSWANPEPRWMENDPALVTAYAVIALEEARR